MHFHTNKKSEDIARDELRDVLGLSNPPTIISGTGQQTSFKYLGFTDKVNTSLKPDGWYLPEDKNSVAIICETKNSDGKLEENLPQLKKYIQTVRTKYNKVIGIIYNGYNCIVYKNDMLLTEETTLKSKEYYFDLFSNDFIDKNLIYNLTKKINDNLHINFGMKNLYNRMVFTACALVVASRYDITKFIGMDYDVFHNAILSNLNKSLADSKNKNSKLNILIERYSAIQINFKENQDAIDDFINNVAEIAKNINSKSWQGEDVMAIFFNEFTRYKGKSESGQVFTPDHIANLMYRITETTYKDTVLDACCGSGTFLVRAMCNMIHEVQRNGIDVEDRIKQIKSERLYGIEFDKEVFALVCANMLVHKDGKTNIDHNDSRTLEAAQWIKSKKITRVLMNPPYESKYGCLDIVSNVLNNVQDGCIAAFILPDNKLVIGKSYVKRWFNKHTLQKIIKLPDVFGGMAGVSTSIFIFKVGEPQQDKRIFACWIENDGFETVKNQGRQDTKGKWQSIENKWVQIIKEQNGDDSIQWIDPYITDTYGRKELNSIMYQMPISEFQIDEKDFKKTILDYVLFESQIDEKDFKIIISNSKGM